MRISSHPVSTANALAIRPLVQYADTMSRTTSLTKPRISTPPNILQDILGELRMLRSELALFLPYEDVDDFAHPRRIRRSYQNAIKRHPPASVWK